MNTRLKQRASRQPVLPTVLLSLALAAGFASVGQTQDIPETTVSAQKTSVCVSMPSLQAELQATARDVIVATQTDVVDDLNVRLARQQRRSFRVAGLESRPRG